MGVTLLASAAQTASGTQDLQDNFSGLASASLLLNLTAAATEVGDTLDVYIQHSADCGTTYDDFVAFTQMLGNGGAKKFVAEWSALDSPESELHAPADAALAAGVLQGPKGGKWRIKWVIVDVATTGNASFTFSIDAELHRRDGRLER